MKDEKKKTTKTVKKEIKPTKIEEKQTIKKQIIKKSIKEKEVKEENSSVINRSVEFGLLEVIVIVLITGIAVSIASGLIVYNNYDKINIENNVNVKTPPSELDEFVESYNNIVNGYVEEVDKKGLIDAAISGMYNYLGDEYSTYINESDASDFEEQLKGEYEGVGIEITTLIDENEKQYVQINRTFKDSPAEKAGLKNGDIILKVDGVEMNDSSAVADTIKKGNKESYEITYKRDGKEYTVTLKREKVFINSVSGEVHENVGYIKLETFSATTKDQIIKHLDSFDNNVESLVIDVRSNTGGYLDTASEVSDLFIEKGKVLYQIKERNDKTTKFKARNGVYRKFNKIVVLINEGNASASEILALALRDSASATIVGVKSYGKGTVQEASTLKSGSMVKYTTSYWLGPDGESINKVGIKPDIEVEGESEQLESAIKAAK